MTFSRSDFDVILHEFRNAIVMTITELANLLGISTRNTHRHLKKWNTFTSYNKNGRYYVLPDIPKFDSHGLWSINGIHFSKYGNLKKTVNHFVNTAEMGLDAMAIGKLLKLEARSFISHFGKSPDLQRKKIAGCFVYFSCHPELFEKQLEKRIEYTELQENSLVSDAVGIQVLIEKIKFPNDSLEYLSQRLRIQKVSVSAKQIEEFFLFHDLLKKTPDSISL